MQAFINKLPTHFRWTIHNLVAHPVAEILYLLSILFKSPRINDLGDQFHDSTIPNHEKGQGRG